MKYIFKSRVTVKCKTKVQEAWKLFLYITIIFSLSLSEHSFAKLEKKENKKIEVTEDPDLDQEESSIVGNEEEKEELESEESDEESEQTEVTKEETPSTDILEERKNDDSKKETEITKKAEERLENNEKIISEKISNRMESKNESDEYENKDLSIQKRYVEIIPKEALVEIEKVKPYQSYKNRRTRHGALFSINVENLYFPDFTSGVDGKNYEELFGQEDISLIQAQLGYKLNVSIGSLFFGIGYGNGSLTDNRSVNEQNVYQERSLEVTKTSVNGQILLDGIFNEPYAVPYFGINYQQMDFKEKNLTTGSDFSENLSWGLSYTVGVMIQLNWLDKESSFVAYKDNGIENTYLDIFWTQYENTGNENDPKIANDFNLGAGLRVEF